MYQNHLTNAEILQSLCSGKPDAAADVEGSSQYPELNGKVKFYKARNGVVVEASVYGLPESGEKCGNSVFALHIHNGTGCTGNQTDPFADAGVHYNPENCPHPEHAGDLPPLFSNGGYAWMAVFTERFKLEDVMSLPVIIHARPDDFTTQPSGNAGSKIACGIIYKT
jgi:Cu/Zn superoxide dismutase